MKDYDIENMEGWVNGIPGPSGQATAQNTSTASNTSTPYITTNSEETEEELSSELKKLVFQRNSLSIFRANEIINLNRKIKSIEEKLLTFKEPK